MNIAFLHLHQRIRIHQKHEPFPHPNRAINSLDKVVYCIGIIGPLMAIPQVMKIWTEKDASGLSLISVASYVLFSSVWAVYGFIHKEKPILITNALWLVLNGIIVAGIVIYG